MAMHIPAPPQVIISAEIMIMIAPVLIIHPYSILNLSQQRLTTLK